MVKPFLCYRGEFEARCLRRSLLLEALAKELPLGTIRYSSKVVEIEEDGYLMLLHLSDGSSLKTKVIFNAIRCHMHKSSRS